MAGAGAVVRFVNLQKNCGIWVGSWLSLVIVIEQIPIECRLQLNFMDDFLVKYIFISALLSQIKLEAY